MYSTLSYEDDGYVRAVGLRRAEKRNAFDPTMLRELVDAYTRFEDDAEARCLLLFAHGAHFTAGLDLAQVGPHVAAGGALHEEHKVDPLALFGRPRHKPVVVAVQGYCFTIGIELCLASDVRLAASDARFTQLEVARGIMPFGGATLRFPQVAGWGNAMRWMLTGDFFDASEALRLGLVQQVVPPEALYEAARAVAQTIAAQAPRAVQATMRSSRVALEQGHEAAKRALLDETRALMATEDAAEGVRSFVERRAARFTGR